MKHKNDSFEINIIDQILGKTQMIKGNSREREMLSKWWHRSFLTSIPLTRRLTSNSPYTGHYSGNPSPHSGCWSTCPTKQQPRRTTLWRYEEGLHSDHIASPLGWQITTQRAPSWTYSFSSGKTDPRGGHLALPAYGLLPGMLTLVSPLGDHWRNRAWPLGMEKGEWGLQQTAVRFWWLTFLLAGATWADIPASSSAYL